MKQSTLRLHSIFISRNLVIRDPAAADVLSDWAKDVFGLAAYITHLPHGFLLTRGKPTADDRNAGLRRSA